MSTKLAFLLTAAIALGLGIGHVVTAAAPVVTVKVSPTPPWIEVYHDGELTSEWQPADGPVYKILLCLLNDDLYLPNRSDQVRQFRTMLALL